MRKRRKHFSLYFLSKVETWPKKSHHSLLTWSPSGSSFLLSAAGNVGYLRKSSFLCTQQSCVWEEETAVWGILSRSKGIFFSKLSFIGQVLSMAEPLPTPTSVIVASPVMEQTQWKRRQDRWAESQGMFLALLGLPHYGVMYFQVGGACVCKILQSPKLLHLCNMAQNLPQVQVSPITILTNINSRGCHQETPCLIGLFKD